MEFSFASNENDLKEKYLVAGVGNTWRGDDGLGIKALGFLREEFSEEEFDFLEFSNKSIDILNYLTAYSATFIIDAVDFGLPPGEVKLFELGKVNLEFTDHKISSHSLSLPELLELYRVLELKNKVFIIGVQPASLAYTEELSEKVKACFPQIITLIKKKILFL